MEDLAQLNLDAGAKVTSCEFLAARTGIRANLSAALSAEEQQDLDDLMSEHGYVVAAPDVVMQETGGDILSAGAISDSQIVQRIGAALVGQAFASPATITADQNDYDPGTGSLFRLSSDASRNITGIADGANGRPLVLINVGSQDIVLTNQDAASAAANRIITGTGASIIITPDGYANLWYDPITARWRVMASAYTIPANLTTDHLKWSTSAVITGGDTAYVFAWADSWASAESDERTTTKILRTGTLKRLYVEVNTAPVGSETHVTTVRIDGVPTALTTTITGAATTGSDLTNTVAVVSGEDVTLQDVASASAVSARLSAWLGCDV